MTSTVSCSVHGPRQKSLKGPFLITTLFSWKGTWITFLHFKEYILWITEVPMTATLSYALTQTVATKTTACNHFIQLKRYRNKSFCIWKSISYGSQKNQWLQTLYCTLAQTAAAKGPLTYKDFIQLTRYMNNPFYVWRSTSYGSQKYQRQLSPVHVPIQ